MEIELINQDINNYIKKYTRFMSKKMYITKKMYTDFTNSYEYIYELANNSIINYNNDKNYQKLLEIKQNGQKLLKLHNKKYLEELSRLYQKDLDANLTKQELLTILCEEDRITISIKNNQKKLNLIKNKIIYLTKIKKENPKSICLITDNKTKQTLSNLDISIYTPKEFESILTNKEEIISNKEKQELLCSYIKDILYQDKEKFKIFYETFKDKLYFTKDVLEYETFKDYHNYISKRKQLNSNTDLNSYVKKLILTKTNNLYSIKGELYKNKSLVDIANTLYCSGIEYKYIEDDKSSYFLISNNDIDTKIEYIESKQKQTNQDEKVIYLYEEYKDNTNCIQKLIYELVKKRYPIEKKSYEEILVKLKENSIDNYYIKFIEKIVIPFINTINKYNYKEKDLNKLKNNLIPNLKKEFEILLDFYNYYNLSLAKSNKIDLEKIVNQTNQIIKSMQYKHLIIDNSKDLTTKYNFKNLADKLKLFIIEEKDIINYSYLMPNIKLFCDFKSYLNEYKTIPILNVYYTKEENDEIAYEFTKNNIERVCNNYQDTITNKKKIDLYIYDDSNRLKLDINRNYLLSKIASSIKKEKIMLMGRDNKDLDYTLIGEYFNKLNESSLTLKDKNLKIEYLQMKEDKISIYDIGILVNPIDSKNDFPYDSKNYEIINLLLPNTTTQKYDWEKKMFYNAISRIKEKLIVICPKSRVGEYIKNIANNNEVRIKKEIYSTTKSIKK